MRDVLVALLLPAVLVGGGVGAADPTVELTFEDPEIIESSGLAVVGDWLVTVNDSGDTGRVFTVDGDGRTVGVTRWTADPADVEAVAPAGPGSVWVGDIGDNRGLRDSITVTEVPVGTGDRDVRETSYELVYPDGARDAESLLTHPTTGRVYVATKEIFGGLLFEAPADLDPDRPNLLTELGPVLSIATDAAFFPDGRHLVVRSYENAVVYGFPSLQPVAELELPDQDQGEGLAVTADGDLLLTTEGQYTDVLRVPLPDDVLAAMADPTPTPSSTATDRPDTVSREDRELPETTETVRSPWPWFLGGFIGLGMIMVLMRSLRRR